MENQVEAQNQGQEQEQKQDMSSALNAQEMINHQQLFSYFDRDDSGVIPISAVSSYMRGLGHCPTESEIRQILTEFNKLDKESLSFQELMAFITKRPKEQCIEEELIEVFQGIQSYHGASSDGSRSQFIQVLAMKKTLCDAGEVMSDAQFDDFVEFLNSSGLKSNEQDFNFRNLAKIMAYGYMGN